MGAILSDTGGFVFSNTTSNTFRIAAQLMNERLDIRQMTYLLFDETSQTKLRLTGEVFSNARFLSDGRVAIGTVSQEQMRRLGAVDEDLDGLVGQLRSAHGVDVAFMLREMPDGTIRVNIRSDERFVAADFASRFGGGGHPRAAGMTLSGISLQAASEWVAGKAGEELSPVPEFRNPVSGILLVNKPVGITSFKVVSVVRRLFGMRRVGHCGTLVPFADGLLPIVIGRATRAVYYMDALTRLIRSGSGFAGARIRWI
jgi:hypothetical protein